MALTDKGEKKPGKKPYMAMALILTITVLAFLLSLAARPRARSMGPLTACKANLKSIGTALECYSSDNLGRYPDQAGKLVPGYLDKFPTCPATIKLYGVRVHVPFLEERINLGYETSGTDTYSASYRVSVKPDSYTIMCQGSYHMPQCPANFPQYDSSTGLREK